jgi:hypothetical protein
MNYINALIRVSVVGCAIGFIACRDKKSNQSIIPPSVVTEETSPTPILPASEQRSIPESRPSEAEEKQISEHEKIAQVLLKQSESLRASVFNVPLDEEAARDRALAWERTVDTPV